MLIKFLSGIFVAYVGIVALLYMLQTRMLFPAGVASANAPKLPPSAREIELTTPSGTVLAGILFEAESSTTPAKPYLVGFGGNAWNANATANYIHDLFPAHPVVVFHYRGYRPSTGHPSAENLLADSLLIFDHVSEHLKAERVVAIGFSIGSGVVADLASKRELQGLILVSPFDSLSNVASEHYPWLPVRWLLRHEIEPQKAIQGVTAPTAIIAAENDSVIPPDRTQALLPFVNNLVLDRTIKDAGHNDLYTRETFRSTIRDALKLVEEKSGSGSTDFQAKPNVFKAR